MTIDFLKAIWQPGDVREIRAFDETGKTWYGYFDTPESAAKTSQSFAANFTVYITLNPVKRACMARSANKMKQCGKNTPTTSDKDIEKLKYLLIDCDPDRPAGISATRNEKKEAEIVATKIIAELGHPLLFGDSGNGYHLIYKHDAETKEALKGFLADMATRHNTTIKIDTAVFNPARITKVLGTWAKKGENTKERPHRQSALIQIFDKPVTLHIPLPPEKQAKQAFTGGKPDVNALLGSRIKEIVQEGATTKYILHECLFDSSHKGKDAVIYQGENEPTTYHCFHDSCQTRQWKDVKESLGIQKQQTLCHTCQKQIAFYQDRDKWKPCNIDGSKHSCVTSTTQETPKPQIKKDKETKKELPPFPLEIFPQKINQYLMRLARALSVPVDFVGTAFLAQVSLLLKKSSVQIKPGWSELPTIYAALVGEKSSGKTPAIMAVLETIFSIEKELQSIRDAEFKAYSTEIACYESSFAIWKQERKKGSNLTPPEKPERPPCRTIYTTDATIEALGTLLRDNQSVILYRDELTAWVKSLDMYRGGRGGDREFFLSNWSGTPTKIDRKNDNPLIISSPCLSVLGGIVPNNLPKISSEIEDGFFDRILCVFPDAIERKWNEDEIKQEEIAPTLYKIWQSPSQFFYLSEEARLLYAIYYENLHEKEDNPKMASYCARFAMILSALRSEMEISGKRISDACILAEYYSAHAQKVREKLSLSKELKQDNAILAWARKKELKSITIRDVVRAHLCKTSKDAKERFSELVDLEVAVWTKEGKEIEI